jgi:DNA-binding YbaB/EbfC family protein
VKGTGGFGNLMKQAKRIQEEMERAQAEIAEMRVEASAGGGMVTATVTGQGDLANLKIEREVVDPGDVEMLIDLIIAAVQEAQSNAREAAQQKLGPLTQGLNLPGMLPG